MYNMYIAMAAEIGTDTWIMAAIGIIATTVSIMVAISASKRTVRKEFETMKIDINSRTTEPEVKSMILKSEENTDLKLKVVNQRIDSTQKFQDELKKDNTDQHNELKSILNKIADKIYEKPSN